VKTSDINNETNRQQVTEQSTLAERALAERAAETLVENRPGKPVSRTGIKAGAEVM
jgi:hypothetical protein